MIGIAILTLLALILGILLVVVDSKVNKKDKKVEAFLQRLPGYNCGACGFGSCDGMASAMKGDVDNYKKCRLLRGDALKEMEEYTKK